MKKVILYTQNHCPVADIERAANDPYDAISHAAVSLAEEIHADVIICQTASGATAEAIAAQRPTLPIITATSSRRVAGQLALAYANSAFVRDYSDDYGIHLARELKSNGYMQVPEGRDNILAVIVSGRQNQIGGTDTIKVRYV